MPTTTVNLADHGLTEGEIIDSYLIDHFNDGTEVIIPDGQYEFRGSGFDGVGDAMLRAEDSRVVLNQEDAHDYTPLLYATHDTVTYRNLTFTGIAEGSSAHRVDADSGAQVNVEGVWLPDGSYGSIAVSGTHDGGRQGFFIDPNISGTARFYRCYVYGFEDNAIYGSGRPGEVIIEECLLRDNDISNGRIGGDGHVFRNNRVELSMQPDGNRALYVRDPGDNMVIEGNHFHVGNSLAMVFHEDIEGQSTMQVDDNLFYVEDPHDAFHYGGGLDFSQEISGSGNEMSGSGDVANAHVSTTEGYFSCIRNNCTMPETWDRPPALGGSTSGYPGTLWNYDEPNIDTVVNLNNQGLSDGDYVDGLLDQHLADGVRVEIEPGTYDSDGSAFDQSLSNCEVRGLGALGSVRFDITDLNSRTDIHAASGRVVINNITRVGRAQNCRHRLTTASDAELILKHYWHPDGMYDGTEDSILWIPNAASNGSNDGLIRLLWCHAEHAADNGAYLEAEGTPGSLIVVGGLYKDCNISALRFGGLDNTRVYGVTVHQTGDAPTHASGSFNLRGMRVNEAGENHHVDNIDVYHATDSYTPIEFNSDAVGSTGVMENVRIYTESSAPAIEEDSTAADGWSIKNIDVTGPGNTTVEPVASDVCTGSGCDAADTDPWLGEEQHQSGTGVHFSYTTADDGTAGSEMDVTFVLAGDAAVARGLRFDSAGRQISTDTEGNTVFGSRNMLANGTATDTWEIPPHSDVTVLDLVEDGGQLKQVEYGGVTYTRDEFTSAFVQGMNVKRLELRASPENAEPGEVRFLIRDR